MTPASWVSVQTREERWVCTQHVLAAAPRKPAGPSWAPSQPCQLPSVPEGVAASEGSLGLAAAEGFAEAEPAGSQRPASGGTPRVRQASAGSGEASAAQRSWRLSVREAAVLGSSRSFFHPKEDAECFHKDSDWRKLGATPGIVKLVCRLLRSDGRGSSRRVSGVIGVGAFVLRCVRCFGITLVESFAPASPGRSWVGGGGHTC